MPRLDLVFLFLVLASILTGCGDYVLVVDDDSDEQGHEQLDGSFVLAAGEEIRIAIIEGKQSGDQHFWACPARTLTASDASVLQVEPTGLGRDAYYGADVSGTYYRVVALQAGEVTLSGSCDHRTITIPVHVTAAR